MTAHYVYRIYAEDRDLIYIGCTSDVPRRLLSHKQAWWSSQAQKVTAKVYPDRTTALQAETAAIRDELPAWNIRGKRRNTDGWATKHFVAYMTEVLKGDPLSDAKLLELHRLADIHRQQFDCEVPVELPVFELIEPHEVREHHAGFAARRMVTGSWLLSFGTNHSAGIEYPGTSGFDWVNEDFKPLPRQAVSA
jgi:predicted GIY-YIG superfamily endonuclease